MKKGRAETLPEAQVSKGGNRLSARGEALDQFPRRGDRDEDGGNAQDSGQVRANHGLDRCVTAVPMAVVIVSI